MLALFVVLVWLVFLVDCVGGLALNLYWPTWERDISTWTDGDSSPTATPTAETAQAVRRAPAEAQLDRRARRQVQRRLRDEGFDPGTPAGDALPGTSARRSQLREQDRKVLGS